MAEQLQKGDKIRIGINGAVHSHDLKVKKWVKGQQSPTPDGEGPGLEEMPEEGEKEEEEEVTEAPPESAKEKPLSEVEDDLFGEMM